MMFYIPHMDHMLFLAELLKLLIDPLLLRAIGATLSSLLISLVLAPRMVEVLKKYHAGQPIRHDGPARHQSKRGTPTMGGLLIIFSIVASTLLWADLSVTFVWFAMGSLVFFGAIGFIDDYLKIRRHNSIGLKGGQKLALQFLFACVLLGGIIAFSPCDTRLIIPILNVISSRPWLPLYIFAAATLIVFSSNAVNLTDGLDGMASSITTVSSVALAAFSFARGSSAFGHSAQLQELTVFCFALVGASAGFLKVNKYPARVFMGDVGALAIGAAQATTSIMINYQLAYPVIGGVFMLEALSVIVQVFSYRVFKKRVFRMAPLHHHFEKLYELKPVKKLEPRIVLWFFFTAVLFALLSLTMLGI